MFAISVLVVDDAKESLAVMGHMLRGLGCAVIEVEDGERALRLLTTLRFDLVLLDIHLPDISGLDVVRVLRQRLGNNSDVHVVAITADVSLPRSTYIAAGFDDYRNRPLSVSDLQDLLQQVRRPSTEQIVKRAG